ncbi:MAG: hypothetical protein WAM61_15055, partial [Desulfobacterales bacterium]
MTYKSTPARPTPCICGTLQTLTEGHRIWCVVGHWNTKSTPARPTPCTCGTLQTLTEGHRIWCVVGH